MDLLFCLGASSILDISLPIIIGIILLAFVCEYMDSSLGMGYGTTLAPVLLLFGFELMQIVPAILFSELLSGLLAGYLHHRHGNVDFKPKIISIPDIAKSLNALGYIETFKRGVPLHLKVALLLAFCSIFGTVAAVFVALNIPRFYLKLYIGILVLSMGVVILICMNRKFKFSWKKVSFLGLLASFNKGMSGGGYGPVVTSGQILSGLDSRNAVAITSLAEGLTCFVGVITYALVAPNGFNWSLVPWLTIGAIGSVPFSTVTVKKLTPGKLKILIACCTIILGSVTLIKTLLN